MKEQLLGDNFSTSSEENTPSDYLVGAIRCISAFECCLEVAFARALRSIGPPDHSWHDPWHSLTLEVDIENHTASMLMMASFSIENILKSLIACGTTSYLPTKSHNLYKIYEENLKDKLQLSLRTIEWMNYISRFSIAGRYLSQLRKPDGQGKETKNIFKITLPQNETIVEGDNIGNFKRYCEFLFDLSQLIPNLVQEVSKYFSFSLWPIEEKKLAELLINDIKNISDRMHESYANYHEFNDHGGARHPLLEFLASL